MTSRNQKDKKQEGRVYHVDNTGMKDELAQYRNTEVLHMVGGGRRMENWAGGPPCAELRSQNASREAARSTKACDQENAIMIRYAV